MIEATEAKTEFTIPEHNLASLRRDIERLNKRARRLGLAEIVAEVVREEWYEDVSESGLPVQRRRFIVHVEGTTPVLAGWQFVAALKHVEGSVLVKVATGATLPDQYLTASPDDCDHCHARRRRLAAFVLRHENGRTALVGRNCLADFIRTTSPETLASQAEFLTSLDFAGYEIDDEPTGERRQRGHSRINAEDYMVAVLRTIKAEGKYVSKKTAWALSKPQDKVKATFEIALFVKVADATEDERNEARAIIEWAQAWGSTADPSKEDYRFNVGVVAAMEYVEDRVWPIFASIPAAKERAEARAEARRAETARPSEFVGTVAKREVFTLTVSKPVKVIEHAAYVGGGTDFTYLYSFEDAQGNEVRYFASRPLFVDRGNEPETLSIENELGTGDNDRPPRVGDTIELKATVKKHEVFNDRKQTVITRGVVVRLLAAGPVAA